MTATAATNDGGGRGDVHPVISLTDFVDFVAKSGKPKQTQVEQVKWRPAYSPGKDFWLSLRQAITEFHTRNGTNKAELDAVLRGLSGSRRTSYPPALTGYKRFLGRKTVLWTGPVQRQWDTAALSVRANPELGVTINGTPHQLKLYFKKESLAKAKADLILLLMAEALRGRVPAGTEFSLLDVQRGKLFSSVAPDTSLLPLLEGEAISFATIWNRIPNTRPSNRTRHPNEDAA